MQSDQLRSALRTRPSRPFTVVTTDGSKYSATHPETVAVAPSGRTAVLVTESEHHVLEMASITEFFTGRMEKL